jgi:hypothetical protein
MTDEEREDLPDEEAEPEASEPQEDDDEEREDLPDEEAEPEASEPQEDDDDEHEGPVDQLGIPMSREPTIDDVRGDGDAHRRLAIGCSVVVTLFILAFWLVRGYLL